MKMDEKATREQSLNAYNQWCVQWREHAKIHSKYKMKPLTDFLNVGVGKAILCIANGYSFEQNIETIKKYRENVDIICCDKTLKSCIENGIYPDYCLVADANVDYEKYLKPVQDKLQDTILFMNVCGNPQWSEKGNWKDRYFTVYVDVIQSEVEFSNLSGCPNTVPAGTNVSNAMVVLLTQSDNNGRRNFFGYDKILLIGYDYCWLPAKKYYAFDEFADGKYNYMRHIYLINRENKLCYSSNNLIFSARWLEKYVSTFNLLVVSCSKNTILTMPFMGELEEQMQYSFKRTDAEAVEKLSLERESAFAKLKQIDSHMRQIGKEHYKAFRASV